MINYSFSYMVCSCGASIQVLSDKSRDWDEAATRAAYDAHVATHDAPVDAPESAPTEPTPEPTSTEPTPDPVPTEPTPDPEPVFITSVDGTPDAPTRRSRRGDA